MRGRPAAVFKSTDGGGSWSRVNAGLTDANIVTLAIDPLTPTTLYMETWGGLFKTTDGGGTWTAVAIGLSGLNQRVYALAVNPQTPTTLYLGTCCYYGTTGVGVLKSTDGGGSWSAVNAGLMNRDIFTLAIDPQTPTTLYPVAFLHQGILSGGVFKSADGGGSWSLQRRPDGSECPGPSHRPADPDHPLCEHGGRRRVRPYSSPCGCCSESGAGRNVGGGTVAFGWSAGAGAADAVLTDDRDNVVGSNQSSSLQLQRAPHILVSVTPGWFTRCTRTWAFLPALVV